MTVAGAGASNSAGLMSLLAEHIIDVVSDPSAAGVRAAKERLLHGMRVSLASVDLPPSVAARAAFSDDSGPCLAFGRSLGLSAPDAAFVNGVVAHSSLQEDCGPGGLREGSHPGTYIIPAALAATEESGGSGLDLVRGLIAGYEVVSRIGAASPSEIVRRRFRPVGVMGPFGAAAAAVVASGGDSRALAGALDIAGNMSSGSTQGVFDGTMEPYFHAGAAARNGLLAARLGLSGAVTSPHSLEGEFGFFTTYGGEQGSEELLLGSQDRLGIERVGSKQFAACLQNQETMALISSMSGERFDPDDIVGVVIERPALGTHGLNSPGVSRTPPFDNMLHAQMSARFTAAAAMTGGAGDDPEFFRDHFADAALTALSGRTELVPTDSSDEIVVEILSRSRGFFRLESDGSSSMFPSYDVLRARLVASIDRRSGSGEELACVIDDLESVDRVVTLTTSLRHSDAAAAQR